MFTTKFTKKPGSRGGLPFTKGLKFAEGGVVPRRDYKKRSEEDDDESKKPPSYFERILRGATKALPEQKGLRPEEDKEPVQTIGIRG